MVGIKLDNNVIELLEYLQDIIEGAAKVPITGKVVIDRKEALEIIDQIVNYLPDEIKKAQWVMSERDRILGEAQNDYENLKKQTINMVQKQVQDHDIVRAAELKAQEIISQAQRDAKTMRLGARDYADEIVSQLEKEIDLKTTEFLSQIKNNVEIFGEKLSNDLNRTSDSIRENIKELRKIQ